MDDRTQTLMLEATRLTREGKLHQATALIQRTLAGLPGEDHEEAPIFLSGPARPPSSPGAPEQSATHVLPDTVSRGAVGARVSTVAPSASGSTGEVVAGSVTCGAGTRSYRLYIPSGRASGPLPLIVLLHGCTQDAEDLARGTRMNALAEREPFLALYPEQSARANGQRCWNWFRTRDQRRDAGEPSIIAACTRHIMATVSVDADRVYVAGMSAGGAMAAIMGATNPDLYAAVGVHSGLPYRCAHDLRSALVAMQSGADGRHALPNVPMIVFHGTADTTVNPGNADALVGPLRRTGLVSRETGRVPGGHAFTRSVYRDGEREVEQWLVEGAGHAWSGGSPDGSFTDARGPDASAEMVRFFRDHLRRT